MIVEGGGDTHVTTCGIEMSQTTSIEMSQFRPDRSEHMHQKVGLVNQFRMTVLACISGRSEAKD